MVMVPPLPEEVKFSSHAPVMLDTAGVPHHALTTLLDRLLQLMTRPTFTCKKMIRQGGKFYQKMPDGHKYVCLDAAVAPTPNSCLVYSFGVGGDLTFDRAMGQFGCEVLAFDDDPEHDAMKRYPFPRVTFLHVLVSNNRDVRLVNWTEPKQNSSFIVLSRPIDNIMLLLHHQTANIDLLKIDIDGPEFEVLEQSLFETHVLERTRQLSIEVHLSALQTPLNSSTILTSLTNYIRVLEGLESRGLRLAYYEPNYLKPTVISAAGRVISVYAELVWVNIHLQTGTNISQWEPLDEDFDNLEMAE
ncbi:hypothetical protein Pmani_036280 [Petrolisthes manimaculis]|uniref:Methyltransferase domain-containing protein n=1 Tax=Petrolisthes manimaculis TaxID=1843537 RepID=A0AAE1NKI4_9EUCA|nr:hypothetical protein Pmani_036280 [Petrolisthes manimaculis]